MINKNFMFIQLWKFFPPTELTGPPSLFDFGHFFLPTYVIRTPCLLETLECTETHSYLCKGCEH